MFEHRNFFLLFSENKPDKNSVLNCHILMVSKSEKSLFQWYHFLLCNWMWLSSCWHFGSDNTPAIFDLNKRCCAVETRQANWGPLLGHYHLRSARKVRRFAWKAFFFPSDVFCALTALLSMAALPAHLRKPSGHALPLCLITVRRQVSQPNYTTYETKPTSNSQMTLGIFWFK